MKNMLCSNKGLNWKVASLKSGDSQVINIEYTENHKLRPILKNIVLYTMLATFISYKEK